MKKNFALLCLTFVWYASPMAAQTECPPAKYMLQAVANIIAKAKTVNNATDLGFQKDVCIMGAWLPVGKSVGWKLTLRAGTRYVFIGGGDDDVSDLDIYLYNAAGSEVGRDNKSDKTPVVEYTPSRTAEYTVKVKMYAAAGSGSFASMAIMSDNGYNIPLSNFKNAAAALFTSIQEICNLVDEMSFLDTDNQWALFGSVLDEKEERTIINIRLDDGKNIIIGASDQNADDIDLFLNDNNSTLLTKDDKADKKPLIGWNGNEEGSYQVKMKNAESDGYKSLVMIAITNITKRDSNIKTTRF